MGKLFKVAPSPHVQGKESVKRIMLDVIIALIPAVVLSYLFFGLSSIVVIAVAVAAAVGFEYLMETYLIKSGNSVKDLSAVITGILLGLNLPSGIPIWLVVLGAFIAIVIAKLSFGGLGQNLFNPALVGRVFLLISYPVQMTTWSDNLMGVDGVSGATPLALLKQSISDGMSMTEISKIIPSDMDLLMGNVSGSMGEVSAIALLLGAAYMLFRKVITWHIPVSILGTIAIVQAVLFYATPDSMVFGSPIYHLFAGGVFLGALFMATDMATSPMSNKGQLIYGVGIGVITVAIRNWGAYPEGISFAILIMNAFTPLINTYVKPKRFGGK